MSGGHRRSDWEILGLEPGAGPDDIRKAYVRRRSLYRSDSLATYALLSEAERNELNTALEEAACRLLGDHPGKLDDDASMVRDLPPDPVASPGAYLRHHRIARGLSLQHVTDRTKILSRQLEMLENEDLQGLPAAVYVRGFVLQVARLLGIPAAEDLAARYAELVRSHRGR